MAATDSIDTQHQLATRSLDDAETMHRVHVTKMVLRAQRLVTALDLVLGTGSVSNEAAASALAATPSMDLAARIALVRGLSDDLASSIEEVDSETWDLIERRQREGALQ